MFGVLVLGFRVVSGFKSSGVLGVQGFGAFI